jgi:hypothetical protein
MLCLITEEGLGGEVGILRLVFQASVLDSTEILVETLIVLTDLITLPESF